MYHRVLKNEYVFEMEKIMEKILGGRLKIRI